MEIIHITMMIAMIMMTSTVALLDVLGDIKQTSTAQTQHVIVGVMLTVMILVTEKEGEVIRAMAERIFFCKRSSLS